MGKCLCPIKNFLLNGSENEGKLKYVKPLISLINPLTTNYFGSQLFPNKVTALATMSCRTSVQLKLLSPNGDQHINSPCNTTH